jgi:predicted dehydrogenase
MSPRDNEAGVISVTSKVDTESTLNRKSLEDGMSQVGIGVSSDSIQPLLVKESTPPRPRVLFIGAGSQGHAYAGPITRHGFGTIVGICEPIPFKRQIFGEKYIWRGTQPKPHHQFNSWTDFAAYETNRRARVQAGEISRGDDEFVGVDAIFVCVLDEMHVPVVKGLAPFGLHIMCEKPLATTLEDCISILGAMKEAWQTLGRKTIFGIGHVLRYSPQNLLLRRMVRDEKVIGDIISVQHTEPVGWWHMAHSFVR